MKVTVRYWSWFKDVAGTEREEYALEPEARLADALRAVRLRHPRFEDVKRSTLVAVGVEYRDPEHRLGNGDEISLFPPVQGG